MAFSGVEKHSIVSVGSYGQLKDRVNRYYFEAGLDSMMETLEPQVVLVYGKLPDEIKRKYPKKNFKEYLDWSRSYNLVINNGGRNQVPVPWNDNTGLYRDLGARLRRKKK